MDSQPVATRRRPALFLDRDGVINRDLGYVHRIDQVEFNDGIFELVREARALGCAVVVVTNQAGIGRGLYTPADFEQLSAWMLDAFAAHGAPLDRIYHCPDHPEHGIGPYRRESSKRKPNPGMLLDAARDLGIDLARSVLVGDQESDVEAGRRAGVLRTIRVDLRTDPGELPPATAADAFARSLADIVPYLRDAVASSRNPTELRA